MPVYTYRCENCGVQFERAQKFTESPLTFCPECGKKALRKVYTPVGIVFKGSGFYATDHRSPSGTARTTPANQTGETKSSTSESSDTSSSETSSTPSSEKPKPAPESEKQS